MLAARTGTRLTGGSRRSDRGHALLRGPGKTGTAACSQRGMTIQQTSHRAPCLSPGPPLDVVAWRVCRLREAGFPAALAEALARQRVDLHALLQLVDAGCPPELAARILAPADDPRGSR